MVLWVLILALFGALVALVRAATCRRRLKARVLAVQAMIGVGFLAVHAVATSNPFTAHHPRARPMARDLNPLLQDPGLAFHPPFLYLGYVGLLDGVLLRRRRADRGARRRRPGRAGCGPGRLPAWCVLTFGIAHGHAGGPTTSLAGAASGSGTRWRMPRSCRGSIGTALLHSAIVVEKRDALKSWTILLAILAFSFSLIGTFLVRSGVLTSVHAFAVDPERGVFILLSWWPRHRRIADAVRAAGAGAEG
ncbi:MAG: cytochrome c biogenesis protein CcsA [Desulfobacterales bacterium]|nr:cytochrome c biogenesis protein CcsA [Desulfobacterales bacterium]